ncbi:hypothetical protein EJ05DRAFT_299913 [Pseudovirgaria hyperparasitica]|uniref:Rhodopsin domain-containing protein n=1 Tax=Pseudovirgaria hyperparasitica TaxID=470096 RepID=A0A6A6WEE9_9PEZI|nr:uncharacterized protein EJ05DRAFT_299913 [Pseudovirgaria hyperparasitica]KAF2759491.1 hypothetical protein EJ05DRAFT_299913 [Pseudovirgaria hyperparasitica]
MSSCYFLTVVTTAAGTCRSAELHNLSFFACSKAIMASHLLSRQGYVTGLQPPPGVVSDPTHAEKGLWKANIAIQSICLPIVTTLVFIRLYTKSKWRFHLDDAACFLGWIAAVAYSTTALLMAKHGAGIHQWNVYERDIVPYTRLVYVTMIIYGPCAFLIKSSILLFCARIFHPHRSACVIIYTFIGVMLAYYVPVLVIKAVICRPLSHFWDPASAPDAKCFNQRVLILCDSLMSIITDSIILLLPLPLVSKLKVSFREKSKIAIIFGAGGLATVCGLMRMIDISSNGKESDTTFVFTRINLWGIAEVNIGLICACLPTIQYLRRRCRGWPVSHTTSHGRSPNDISSTRDSALQSPTYVMDNMAASKAVYVRSDSVPSSSRTSTSVTPARSRSMLSVRNPDLPMDEKSDLSPASPDLSQPPSASLPFQPERTLHHRSSSISTPLTSITETIVRGPSVGSSRSYINPLNASSSSLGQRQIDEVEMGAAIVKTVEVEQIESVAE